MARERGNQKMETETYNGWTNYETWNVGLWFGSDEPTYRKLLSAIESDPKANYRTVVRMCRFDRTPDGISYTDEKLNIDELDAFIDGFKDEHNS